MTDRDVEVVTPNALGPRCAHVSSTGRQCTGRQIEGYLLCKWHLSRATIKEIGLIKGDDIAFSDIKGRKVENPLEELAELVSEVLLYKEFCAQQVAKLRGDYRYEGRSGEQLRAEVALYERSLDRAGKLLVEWSRLNIDERLSRIEEAKAVAILEVIRRTLQSAELSDEQRTRAEETAIKELRALNSGH